MNPTDSSEVATGGGSNATKNKASTSSSTSPSKEGHEMRRMSGDIPGLAPRPEKSKKARYDHKGT
jgi:hypothetical protein